MYLSNEVHILCVQSSSDCVRRRFSLWQLASTSPWLVDRSCHPPLTARTPNAKTNYKIKNQVLLAYCCCRTLMTVMYNGMFLDATVLNCSVLTKIGDVNTCLFSRNAHLCIVDTLLRCLQTCFCEAEGERGCFRLWELCQTLGLRMCACDFRMIVLGCQEAVA